MAGKRSWDTLGEAPGLGWAKENPGGLYPPELHGHFVAFVLLLTLVELDGTESHAVAVEELAAGIIVQLHHIGQSHPVALISGRRAVTADGVDLLQIIGTQIAVKDLRIIVCVRFSEPLYQILISDKAHGDIHAFPELPDAAAFLRLSQLLAGHLSGCKAVKYAFLPLRRQIQPGQVAGQLIRLEHLVHNSGVILHIAHRVAIENQTIAIVYCEADQNHITSLQGERLTSAGSWPGQEWCFPAPAVPEASARRRR